MARLELRGLRKDYGTVRVLHEVDLDIEDGELLVLVGPSGCGKSTLLRCIAGLEQISAGELSIGDRWVNDLAPKDRDIAMVFQSYALYPHMTVRQNMAFGLRIRRMEASEIARRVDEAARLLSLDGLLDRLPRQLSGGQRQRVAMGRAIVRRPAVFLFDEPLSNLDAALRVQMRAELARLHQRMGATMIYVTHDQVEAMTLADRIVVLNAGIVQQVGPPLQLYHAPANKFVAGFIGSPAMNFLPGRMLGEEDGRGVVELGESRLELPAGRELAAVGQRLTLGIRPEHVKVAAPGEGTVDGVVEVVEPMGWDAHLHVRLPIGEDGSVVIARAEASRVAALTPESRVALDLRPGPVHLFDAETERAIGEPPDGSASSPNAAAAG